MPSLRSAPSINLGIVTPWSQRRTSQERFVAAGLLQTPASAISVRCPVIPLSTSARSPRRISKALALLARESGWPHTGYEQLDQPDAARRALDRCMSAESDRMSVLIDTPRVPFRVGAETAEQPQQTTLQAVNLSGERDA